jgi:hypothetical protein
VLALLVFLVHLVFLALLGVLGTLGLLGMIGMLGVLNDVVFFLVTNFSFCLVASSFSLKHSFALAPIFSATSNEEGGEAALREEGEGAFSKPPLFLRRQVIFSQTDARCRLLVALAINRNMSKSIVLCELFDLFFINNVVFAFFLRQFALKKDFPELFHLDSKKFRKAVIARRLV